MTLSVFGGAASRIVTSRMAVQRSTISSNVKTGQQAVERGESASTANAKRTWRKKAFIAASAQRRESATGTSLGDDPTKNRERGHDYQLNRFVTPRHLSGEISGFTTLPSSKIMTFRSALS